MANEDVQTLDEGHESGSVRLHLTDGSSVRDLQPEGEKDVAIPNEKVKKGYIPRLVLVAFLALAWALSVAIAFVAGRHSVKAGQAAIEGPLMTAPSRQAIPEPGGTCSSACKDGICYFNIFADLNKELAPLPEDEKHENAGETDDESGSWSEASAAGDGDENAEGQDPKDPQGKNKEQGEGSGGGGRRRFTQDAEDPLGKNKELENTVNTATEEWDDFAPALFEDADVFMFPECGEGSGYAVIIVKLDKEKDQEDITELSEAMVVPEEQRRSSSYKPYRGGYRGRTYGYYYLGNRGNYYRGSMSGGRNGRYYYNRGRNYYNRYNRGGSMGGYYSGGMSGGYYQGGMGGSYNGNRGRYGYYRGGMGGSGGMGQG